MRNTEPEASLGMTSLGGAGGGQILTAVTDPVSCNVKTQREKEISGEKKLLMERGVRCEVGPVYIHTLEVLRSGSI